MFRKTWKTIKFFIAIGILLIVIPHSILPHQAEDINKGKIDEYVKLNNIEKRLQEYADDKDALVLKLKQLDIINNSRKKNNSPAVKLDILASRVANKMSREAADNKFTGHWNLEGEKPYHRYAAAGGYDHVSENAFGEWTTGKYSITPTAITAMMKSGHGSFMSERSPADGHKRNVIDKSHNYVGIGYCLSDTQFRYYEEFIDRYLEFDSIPRVVKRDNSFTIDIKTTPGVYLYTLIAYRDKLPENMTASQISRRNSYNDFTDEISLTIDPWDLAPMRKSNVYKIPLSFDKPGLYYINIFIDNKEMASPSTMDTKGKIQASGVVIRAI